VTTLPEVEIDLARENAKLRQALADLVASLDRARERGATFGYRVGRALTQAKDVLELKPTKAPYAPELSRASGA
jgi:hypothetical protein